MLRPNETVFEGRNFKEEVKVNKGHKGGTPVPHKTGVFPRRGRDAGSVCM